LGNPFLFEVAIWAAMSGVIVTLWVIAAIDALVQRSVPALRGLAVIVLTGGTAIALSGLPEVLWPTLDVARMLIIKSSMGSLGGALAMTYLGIWVGGASKDPLVQWTLTFSTALLTLGGIGLAVAAIWYGETARITLLTSAALGNGLCAIAAGIVAMRSATLGDKLAPWMVVASLFLAGMVAGMYSKALAIDSMGVWGWMTAAASTVAYFLIVIGLTIVRNREMRRISRLARGATEVDRDVEMPLGPRLLPQVEDALWRSARVGRECVVAAVSISNLYAMSEDAGVGVDGEILGVLAARIRRVVGFRNVVGLYHPRCFVLVVSAVQDRKRSELLATRLLLSLRKPVKVGPSDDPHFFSPGIGIGVVTVNGATDTALAAINQAEQLALEAGHLPAGVLTRAYQGVPSDPTNG
jgi:GGDEF domain-containing protein